MPHQTRIIDSGQIMMYQLYKDEQAWDILLIICR